MRVSLVQSGGFTGRRLVASTDTADLPPDLAEAAASLVAQPPPPVAAGGGGGQPQYALTVEAAGVVRQVLLHEATVPPELRPLLQELVRRAAPQ